VASSPDGLTWTSGLSGVGYDLYAVAFGNGSFVAVGQYIVSVGTQITTSPDGTNWTARTSGVNDYRSIAYGDEGFVAPGGFRSASWEIISTSLDGITWTTRGGEGNIDNSQRCVTFGNGIYIIAGNGGRIRQSTPVNARAQPILGGFLSHSGFELSAIVQPGYSYTVQGSTNLAGPNWTSVYSFTSTQAVNMFLDSTATNRPLSLYRISSP
jgi:hypothetical protein